MKRYFQILILTFGLFVSSCCDTFCERHKYAETIIEAVEKYREETKSLPENLTVLGFIEMEESAAFYQRTTDSTYTVWYAIGFESNVYRSQTKEWKEEG